MNKILISTIIFFILFQIQNTNAYQIIKEINGNPSYVYKVIQDGGYKIIASYSNSGATLEDLIKNKNGVAGINGGYFCPADYPSCGGINKTDGDRISNGNISSKWYNTGDRYIFGFDEENKSLIYKSETINKDVFKGIYNGISNFPLILKEGRSFLHYYEEKGLIDYKLESKGYKNFICSTNNGIIYMGYIENQTIFDMVDTLKTIDCYNALNLDSGLSLSSYDNGKYVYKHGRNIMDAFVIVKDSNISENSIKNTEKNTDLNLYNINIELKDKYKAYINKNYKNTLTKFSNNKKKEIVNKAEKILEGSNNERIIAMLYAIIEILNKYR